MSVAQRQNDCFQGSASVVRMQSVVAVRAVLHVVTPEPLRGRGAGDIEHACSFSFGQARFFDLLADFRRRECLCMYQGSPCSLSIIENSVRFCIIAWPLLAQAIQHDLGLEWRTSTNRNMIVRD